ncbi:MAG: DUF4331 domain-containing protein [Deltaproteobacteria bacterium]|nr:DUF4331 domain-containing protein [Deltaproteobacteria bacterium]
MNDRIYFVTVSLAVGLVLLGCGDDGGSAANTDGTTTNGPATGLATSTASGTDGGTVGADSTGETGTEPDGRRGDPPALGGQIDRAGRAAISTATIETFQTDRQITANQKDAFNAAAVGDWPSYVPQIMTSLAILDALDATCGNQLLADAGDNRYEFLATVLSDDRLWINSLSGTCGTYLGVEAEAIGAVEAGAGGCGGRSPSDDVIERSYSVLAAGILAGIDDGVTEDDGVVTDTFPFLGAPQ